MVNLDFTEEEICSSATPWHSIDFLRGAQQMPRNPHRQLMSDKTDKTEVKNSGAALTTHPQTGLARAGGLEHARSERQVITE